MERWIQLEKIKLEYNLIFCFMENNGNDMTCLNVSCKLVWYLYELCSLLDWILIKKLKPLRILNQWLNDMIGVNFLLKIYKWDLSTHHLFVIDKNPNEPTRGLHFHLSKELWGTHDQSNLITLKHPLHVTDSSDI